MELLKNFVYAGVGLAALTTDKVKETVEDLVEKGKISDTEGKKIIEDFFKSTETKKDDFESKMKSLGDNISSKFDFLKKNDDVLEVTFKSFIFASALIISSVIPSLKNSFSSFVRNSILCRSRYYACHRTL